MTSQLLHHSDDVTCPAEKFLPAHERTCLCRGVPIDNIAFTAENINKIQQLQFRSDDIFMPGYPKTGNTWLQEIVWLICNSVDYQKCRSIPGLTRVKMLELALPGQQPVVDQVSKEESPRLFWSHLPRRFFADQLQQCTPRIIYMMRNPKDTLVSFYHFYNYKIKPHNIPTFTDFFELYTHNKLVFGNYFDHTHDWYTNRIQDNTLCVKYEDVKLDHRGQVIRIAQYLDKHLTATQIDDVVKFTSFDAMKERKTLKMGDNSRIGNANPDINPFVRTGEVGGWKSYFTVAQSEYIDKQHEEIMKSTGLTFDYVI